MKTWQDIPQFPRAAWEVDVEWTRLERHLATHAEWGLDLDPDFQRVHVWTDAQRVAWLEYVLSGGEVGRTIICAASDWTSGRSDAPGYFYALADGKQRVETVRRFMRGEVRIFADAARPGGYARGEIGGVFRAINYTLKWRVVETPTRADVLRLYLSINAGGTPHAAEEIARVREMLAREERDGR